MTKSFFLAGVVSALVIGCGKQEPSATNPPAAQPTATTPSPAAAAVETAKQIVTNVAAEAAKATTTAQQAVQEGMEDAGSKAQAVIDQARALIGDKKYSDARGALEKLASLKLSPEQQTLVQGLKVELGKLGGEIENGIGQVKTAVAQKDYNQGLNFVKRLSNYQLTPDQQKVVDGLKAELQKMLGTQAGDEGKKALGNVLGGSK